MPVYRFVTEVTVGQSVEIEADSEEIAREQMDQWMEEHNGLDYLEDYEVDGYESSLEDVLEDFSKCTVDVKIRKEDYAEEE